MKIAYRLGSSFGVLTLLLVLAGGVGSLIASTAQSDAWHAQRDLTATRALKQFQLDGASVAVLENSIGFDYNSHSDPSDDLDRLALAISAFTRDSEIVGRLPLTDLQRSILSNAQRVFNVYVAQSLRANSDFAMNTPDSINAGNDLINDLAYVGVTAGLDNLAVDFGANVDRQVAASRLAAQRAALIVAALGIAGVVCASLLSFVITRSIVRPLGRTVQVLDAVAEGDFTQSLTATSRDEVGQLGRALNRTVGLLRHMMRELTVMARTDPLTGLPNRAAFNAAVSSALSNGSTEQSWVLFIDLDDFKVVNDSLGHHAGDAVLMELANLLRQTTRSADLCARLGGDEFAVLLHDADFATAEAIAQRLAQANITPVHVGDVNIIVKASVGVTLLDRQIQIDELIQHADTAMYAAKARGKGQAAVYSPGLLQDNRTQ